MLNAIHHFFNKSITRLVMASFVFVLLFPLGFLVASLPEESWGSVKNEIKEKHLLIAESIEQSISIYFRSIQKTTKVFAEISDITSITDADGLQSIVDDYLKVLDDVVVVSYFSLDDYSKVISVKNSFLASRENPNSIREEPNLKYLSFGNRHNSIKPVSSVFRSTISKQPVVLIKTYIFDKNLKKRAILFAEIGLSYINGICAEINNSKKERCTIVDSKGKVVVHTKKEWVDEMKNLSEIRVIQDIKRGWSGTMNFISPFTNEEFIAGYSFIENLGWGVVITQPLLELNSPLNKVMLTIFKWLVIGMVLALGIAYMLTRQITKPIHSLVVKSLEADIRSDNFNLGTIPKNTPQEISHLWTAISSLVTRLQEANKKVVKMNYSLHKDIEKATEKLRESNKHLYAISSKDHLTQIANRRYFEDRVEKILRQKPGERASVILIDVDKFKFINDEYGHEAGDKALIHIARLMHQCTRKGDIPARLGGDEFIIYVRNCGPKALQKVAESLRKSVEDTPIYWGKQEINLSLSIGTVNCEINSTTSLSQLIKNADEAMYVSKEQGRNHVSVYTVDPKNS